MGQVKFGIAAVVVALWITLAWSSQAKAQGRRGFGAGSTVQGDILRGEGAYLRGMGYYELNNARANAVNAATAKKIYDWNTQIYNDYLAATNAAHARDKARSRDLAQKAEQKRAETEMRLRTNPLPEEVRSGQALNAMLLDLSNPAIGSAEWRAAPVELPVGVTIESLMFRFVPKPGAKESGALKDTLICLGRLDPGRGWPISLADGRLDAERQAYEQAYRRIVEECRDDRLTPQTALGLRTPLDALKKKVSDVVPSDGGFRASATAHLTTMSKASELFHADTVEFAQDMIRDVGEHQAGTVDELLTFMRKYRLTFAPADDKNAHIYEQLYRVLHEQKRALGGAGGGLQVGTGERPAESKSAEAVAGLKVALEAKIDSARKIAKAMQFKVDEECKPYRAAALSAMDDASKAVAAGRSPSKRLADAEKAMSEVLARSTTPRHQKNAREAFDLIREAIEISKKMVD